MKKLLTTLVLVASLALNVNAQQTKNVGIGTTTPNASAILDLDVSAADFGTKLGLLVPRMTAAQRDAITLPAEGLLVYVTDATPAGFYYRSGSAWLSVSGLRGSGVANQIAYFSDASTISTNANLVYNTSGDLVITNGNIDLLSIATGAAKEVRFHAGAASDNYVAIKAPATLAGNIDFTLPGNAGATGQVLTKTANGTEWQASNSGAIPAGAMMPYAGATAPEGWLLCDGQEVSKTDNSALYAAIGDAYGAPLDQANFKLPNMQGTMPIGANAGTYTLGATGGSATTALTTDNLPAHTHQLVGVHARGTAPQVYPTNYLTANVNGKAALYASDDMNITNNDRVYNILTPYTTVGNERLLAPESIKNTGGGQAVNTMPPYTVVNYIIKK